MGPKYNAKFSYENRLASDDTDWGMIIKCIFCWKKI
jgi:hypothetical protein